MDPMTFPSLRCIVAATTAAALLYPTFAAAQSAAAPSTRALSTARLSGDAPTIDGRVDDDVWTRVEPYTDFVQQDPNEGQPASEKTEVRVTFDDKNLYIGVIAFDGEPDRITYTQSKRDADLTESDSIQFIFDTFNDHQNGFVFGTNPSGVEYDGQVAGEGATGSSALPGVGGRGSTRGALGAFNANWDADWTVQAQVTERGWEAELAIPLKTLRYDPGTGKTWGFNAMRIIRRKNEQVYLQPVPRGYNLTRVSEAAQLDRARAAEAPRPEADAVRGGALPRRQPLHGGPERRQRRCRPRSEVGHHAQPHRRRDREHRLRPGRSRRRAGQPHPLRAVLPRKAAVLPRERLDLPVRRLAADRPLLLAARSASSPAPRRRSSAAAGSAARSGPTTSAS